MSTHEESTTHPSDGGTDPSSLRGVEDSGAAWPDVNRRDGDDRRDQPTRAWDSLLGFRNRKRGRRDGEGQNVYVDVFTRADITLMLSVFVLNILDAFFTLRWLRMGGSEGNPLMDVLIRSDEVIFLIQKCLVVGGWLIVLVIHRNFRIARYGLWIAFFLYAGILIYHFILQIGGPPQSIDVTQMLGAH